MDVALTRTLLTSIRNVVGYCPKVLLIGSAAEYGDQGSMPITEACSERPTSQYGVLKLARTRLALSARHEGIRISVARVFNLLGRSLPTHLAAAQFAQGIRAAIETGSPHVVVGNLCTVRDYLHVDVAARAIWDLLASSFEDGIVNVCSGQGTRTLELFLEIASQTGAGVSPVLDVTRIRGSQDVPVSIGSPALLNSLISWRPDFSLSHSISDLLGH
jgi:GDP-4-dehydro-6-deoxy-D-mannose reductase